MEYLYLFNSEEGSSEEEFEFSNLDERILDQAYAGSTNDVLDSLDNFLGVY